MEEEEKIPKGDDVIVELDASLEDLYMGGSLKVRYFPVAFYIIAQYFRGIIWGGRFREVFEMTCDQAILIFSLSIQARTLELKRINILQNLGQSRDKD